MPTRKRGRRRSRSSSRASRGSGMYAAALRSRSSSRAPVRRSTIRTRGAHTFSRYATVVQESMNGTFLARSYVFKFADLIQAADFSNLFDQYRISKIVLRVTMVNNPDANNYVNAPATVNSTNWYPKLWYIPDYDGGPTETLASIRERQGVRCRTLQPNKMLTIVFRPKCRVLTYSTASSTGYAPKNIKVDMTDTNIEHFGMQFVFDSMQADPADTQPFIFNIDRKFYFTCYGVR